jgi:uncharacterized metal-binding protein
MCDRLIFACSTCASVQILNKINQKVAQVKAILPVPRLFHL